MSSCAETFPLRGLPSSSVSIPVKLTAWPRSSIPPSRLALSWPNCEAPLMRNEAGALVWLAR